MSTWTLQETNSFRKKFDKLIPRNLRKEVSKKIKKLQENPYRSKPLGYKFLREKKIDKWRLYFIIHNQKLSIFFIDLSDKKLQEDTIKKIKEELKNILLGTKTK